MIYKIIKIVLWMLFPLNKPIIAHSGYLHHLFTCHTLSAGWSSPDTGRGQCRLCVIMERAQSYCRVRGERGLCYYLVDVSKLVQDLSPGQWRASQATGQLRL